MSGKYWENHFTQKLKSVGFEPITSWECLFAHRQLKLILSVYVGDSKSVGRSENMEKGWKLMESFGIVLGPPDPLGDYLGCGQFPISLAPEEAMRRLEHAHPLLKGSVDISATTIGEPVRAIRYNMFGLFQQRGTGQGPRGDTGGSRGVALGSPQWHSGAGADTPHGCVEGGAGRRAAP